ncbi:MAG: hypothetical protein COB77_06770 [Gammaproteobacteria bacterium]|nr:MAG: hypothetical protein COB77_06770 [Gammaproteobacteria bacterium]
MCPDNHQTVEPLVNKTILVTRPVDREIRLRCLIEKAGGVILHYPVFTITPPTSLQIQRLIQLQKQLHTYTMAIFISPTAVEQSHLYFPVLPKHLIIASIGSKTTQALTDKHITVDIEAPEHNSESLLLSNRFQKGAINNENILIFRGVGGRALLGDTLVKRGAQLHYVETYQRQRPTKPPLTDDEIQTLNVITISSNNGLTNLIALMKDCKSLTNIPLLVPSQRVYEFALQQGFTTIITAEDATDEATMKALTKYLSS